MTLDRFLARLDEEDARENYVLSTARVTFHGGFACVDCGGSGVIKALGSNHRWVEQDCPFCDGGAVL